MFPTWHPRSYVPVDRSISEAGNLLCQENTPSLRIWMQEPFSGPHTLNPDHNLACFAWRERFNWKLPNYLKMRMDVWYLFRNIFTTYRPCVVSAIEGACVALSFPSHVHLLHVKGVGSGSHFIMQQTTYIRVTFLIPGRFQEPTQNCCNWC